MTTTLSPASTSRCSTRISLSTLANVQPDRRLTDAQKAHLTTVAAMPDEQIDYADAPYLPDAVWAKAGELPGAKQP